MWPIRVSSNSNIPDLETQDVGYGLRTSGSSSSAFGRTSRGAISVLPDQQQITADLHSAAPGMGPATAGGSGVAINIEPHPEVLEKKREVLQELAVQKQAVQEAKGSYRLSLFDLR